MTQTTGLDNDNEKFILFAKMDNARNLANVLKAIQFKDDATIFVSANGLKVTVEDGKYVQASAFIQSSMFQEFICKEDSATFKVNLAVVLECLHIFGTSKEQSSFTTLKMYYVGHGYPLQLLLVEESGVLTDCSVVTQEPDEVLDFDFSGANVINKVIMKSCCLKDAFQEMDMTSEVVQILLSPDNPYFRLSTFGHAGSSHVDYPKDSDMVELFECQQTQANRYKMILLKPSTKALNLSTKISIRTDHRGFLSLQYMIVNEDDQVCFVEFLCAPDEEADEAGGNFQ